MSLLQCAMCGSALRLSLLLWMVVSRTEGEVTAPSNVSAEAGSPLVLGCNITKRADSSVQQVRWLNGRDEVLLAYEQSVPVRISRQQANIQLTTHHNDASYITIKNVQAHDEGCYTCVFDTFPGGSQKAKTCVRVTGKVHLDGNKTAISGKPVTLSCWYSVSNKVFQVLWKKTAEQGDTTTVASYSRNGNHNTEKQFRGRVNLTKTLGETQLTIQSVRTEDEACYTCEFHTFPDGRRSGTACLSVYVLPNPEVTHVTYPSGFAQANCTAQSRPAAEITWNVDGDNHTLGPAISFENDQGDGTTIVTSTLSFQTELLSDRSVKCIVHHRGLEKPLSLILNPNKSPAMVILLSVCGVAAVLLLCLCVCLCKCFVCIDD